MANAFSGLKSGEAAAPAAAAEDAPAAPPVYPSLKGKRVVVTGGASGIGASLVAGFAAQGAETIFVDILEQEKRRSGCRPVRRSGDAVLSSRRSA